MATSSPTLDSFRFQELESVQKLHHLAKTPFDLSAPGALTTERLESMRMQAHGFELQFGTEQVDEDVLKALVELAEETEAVQKMHQMQAGEVINTSEERSVLHTAMRGEEDTTYKSSRAKQAARLAKAEREKLKQFLETKGQKFDTLVQIGIGGSDLGPRALFHALEAYAKPGQSIEFIANVDPDDTAAVLRRVDLSKTVFVVVSKSGNTLETQTNEAIVRERLQVEGIDPNQHFVAVTGKGSPMDNPAQYLESFYIWDYVGGRYSATSMVGGVMLAFALGFEQYEEILEGAHEMDRHALEEDPRKNLPLWSALLGIWNRNFLCHPTLAVIPYSQALVRFPAHLQQCDMESNGKQVDRQGNRVEHVTGPVIWGEPGTNGQHSFYQLIHQGTDKVPVEFIGFKESQHQQDLMYKGTSSQQKLIANLLAQSLALALGQRDENPNKNFEGNRPSKILMTKKLTPKSLGALLSYFENKIAFQGFMWNINSFDQEGVQLGKKLADCLLTVMQKKEGEEYPLGETLLQQILDL